MAAASRASRAIGLVRRNFKDLDKKDFLLLYKTYIRPHLEYCVQAWSPFLERDIECWKGYSALPQATVGVAKYSYEDRLRKLGITTLRRRRKGAI